MDRHAKAAAIAVGATLGVVLLTGTLRGSGSASSTPPASVSRVALIGDSLAVGLGPKLGALYAPAAFRYEAHGGTTPAQWASHAAACGQCGSWLASWAPGLTLVVLGTNDMGGTPNPAQYAAIVAEVRAAGSQVVWVAPPLMPAHPLAAVRAVIDALGVPVIEAAAIPLGPDGIHPTGAGYAQWAHIIRGQT